MDGKFVIIPGDPEFHPNNLPRSEPVDKSWTCEEGPGQWLSWCMKEVDLDKMEEHILGCVHCQEALKKLVRKVELYR